MSKQTINVGSGELVGDGEGIRTAFIKINSNFNELYSNTSTGYTGSIGYTGSQGNVGYTGSASTGTTGYTGSQGNIGYTGSASTGTTGYTGSQGNVGYTGSAGSTNIAILRAQRTTGGTSPQDPTKWTITTIQGSVTGSVTTRNTNGYLEITLTGFTQIPSTILRFKNMPGGDGGYSDSPDINMDNFSMYHDPSGGSGFLSPGSPNILTSFTPSTHKFYYLLSYTSPAQDLYFYFKN